MASSSSDESSKAPENFQVSSTSNDEDDEILELNGKFLKKNRLKVTRKTAGGNGHGDVSLDAAPSLKCFLCLTQQHRFHCRDCVKSGYITRKGQPHGECLSEKQQQFLKVKAKLNEFGQQYEKLIKEKRTSENIRFEIKRHQEQVQLLQHLIANKKSTLLALQEKRNELSKANSDKKKTLPKYPIKVKELEDYVLDRIEKIDSLRERHNTLLDTLKDVTRRGIRQLVEYIFPISEIVLKDEKTTVTAGGQQQQQQHQQLQNKTPNSPTEDAETIAALADAKNTSYIRGKWVIHSSGISEMQYRIVAPSLPANGDYSAYLDWLKDNKDDVPKTTANEIAPSRVSAFRIVGALTYTAQLTQLICYYLNVRLPYKVAYGDFCRKLNEEQFLRKVSRLNSNIMYLAYTQQVKLRSLNENHTLENLLILLDPEKSDLGRHGFQEVGNAPLMKSVDSLLLLIETATESESEDENSFRLDWEDVPNLPTQHDIINTNLITPASGQQHQQQSTIAEGLMTSAANRITSIFRWMK
ncbi:beclin 1-associated autophagy-related key regulator [Musca vetustissima]|uniref:beclin 1-associated autophagy-related key regulator n=1 Tax=Musca vetustissima TaxID=27455 RepID=UPI002AB711F4|nr:beclin 1-associated autophagy-related key regulator [Musca vetustissima]